MTMLPHPARRGHAERGNDVQREPGQASWEGRRRTRVVTVGLILTGDRKRKALLVEGLRGVRGWEQVELDEGDGRPGWEGR